MDIHTLIRYYYSNHPNGLFFDRDTLRFFGEHISEMRVLKGFSTVTDSLGTPHRCYVVSSLQRNAPGGPSRTYHFFDADTFENI